HVLVGLGAGCQGEAAIAHHHAGDTVPARRGAEGIPEDLRVHVGVPIDEAGRDDLPLGVDHFVGAVPDAPDRRDAAAPHADVGAITRQAGSVDYRPVLDHEVIGHRPLLLRSVERHAMWPRSFYFGSG